MFIEYVCVFGKRHALIDNRKYNHKACLDYHRHRSKKYPIIDAKTFEWSYLLLENEKFALGDSRHLNDTSRYFNKNERGYQNATISSFTSLVTQGRLHVEMCIW